MISAASDYGMASPLKFKRQAEEVLKMQSHVPYAIVRVPNFRQEPGGTRMPIARTGLPRLQALVSMSYTILRLSKF